jgi:hypothetical protein
MERLTWTWKRPPVAPEIDLDHPPKDVDPVALALAWVDFEMKTYGEVRR